MNILDELKRRKVFRVAVVYAATAFVILQAADLILPRLGVSDQAMSLIVVLLLLGFPAAMVLGWVLEITPEGLRVTSARPAGEAGEPLPALLGSRTLLLSTLLVAVGIGLGAGLVLGPARSSQSMPAGGQGGAGEAVSPPVDKSIAVLPFADFSPDGNQEWFSDGLTEEILNALARLPDLRVASRTGSFRFRGSSEDVRDIAASLGVGHILEGSVRRTGGQVRITAQLIRASDDIHLWSQNFDRDVSDVIRVQEEIAFEIARTMQTALEPEALRRMVNAGTNSVAAYEAYLRGQHLYRRSGFGDDALQALTEYERAIALDPQFSDAHLAVAGFWMAQMTPTSTISGATDLSYRERERRAEERLAAAAATATDEVRRLRGEQAIAELQLRLREAFDLAMRITELVPSERGAFMSLGSIAMRVGEHEAAASAFRRAAGLTEDDAVGLVGIFNRSHRVDLEGALGLAERALALDPMDPTVLYQSHRVLLWDGRVSEAAMLVERFRESGTDEPLAMMQLRQACAEGRVDDATAIYREMPERWSRWLGLMHLGRHAEAVDILRPLDQAGELYALAGYLEYTFFDPSPFPNLAAALRRQGITRPPPVVIPYACPAIAGGSQRHGTSEPEQDPSQLQW